VQGAWFISAILDALTAVPEVWSKTVLLVNFDENDGFFDHMPSPSAPSPRGDGSFAGKTTLAPEQVAAEYYTHPPFPGMPAKQPEPDGRVYGPGMRVPMHVISPWSKGGWVNSQVFDHTSVLRFLETRFGVHEPNISPYRRAVCGDLTSCFDFATPERKPPALAGTRSKAQADALRQSQQARPFIKPPPRQKAPLQARGARPSRALPYELAVRARVQATQLQLDFINTGRQAAVLHVYDRHRLEILPCRYMVEAGKQLADIWGPREDDGHYDLWVLGPNGFHRQFAGTVGQAAVEASLRYDRPGRRIELLLSNDGTEARRFTLTPNAYGQQGRSVLVAAGARQLVDWPVADSGNWYDLSVAVEGQAGFLRRFAGRMETGADSISDPAA
jgi:phospholipase C